jgi:hypothetical protein
MEMGSELLKNVADGEKWIFMSADGEKLNFIEKVVKMEKSGKKWNLSIFGDFLKIYRFWTFLDPYSVL